MPQGLAKVMSEFDVELVYPHTHRKDSQYSDLLISEKVAPLRSF